MLYKDSVKKPLCVIVSFLVIALNIRSQVLISSSFSKTSAHSQNPKKKILFLALDGVRPDALMTATSPFFHKLASDPHCLYTLYGDSIPRTFSAPSWASILTGTKETDHNILHNKTIEKDTRFPLPTTFFEPIKESYRNLDSLPFRSQSFVSDWPGMKHLQEKVSDKTEFFKDQGSLQNDERAAKATLDHLKQTETSDLVFLYLVNVDEEGHRTGFAPHNPMYLEAIHKIDQQVEPLFREIETRRQNYQEDWLVVITTDHGGTDFSNMSPQLKSQFEKKYPGYTNRGIHGLSIKPHQNVFIFFHHPSLRNQEILPPPSSLDIAPSILDYFQASKPHQMIGQSFWPNPKISS